MATTLTETIDGAYTAPAVLNVHFLDDGSGTGWEDQGTLTDAAGHTFGYDGWTPYEQQQAELAFARFSAVANVVFNVVADVADADFVMATGNAAEVGGPGYWNVGGGTVTVNGVDHVVDGVGVFNWEGQGWDFFGSPGGLDRGGFGFVTLLDAIARGLGLAHPHDTDGGSTVMAGVTSPTGDLGDFGLNQGVYTTMSLNEGWHTAPHGPSPSDSWGWQGGPMALDIAVLQEKYGVNVGTNLGDTVYDMPETSTGAFYEAIWDAGGTDTIRYGGIGHAVIDLRAATLQYEAGGGGFVSHVPGIHGGFTIAHGVVIENATGEAGNDTLIGNGADNVLTGGPGADVLNGGAGSDTASYHTAAGPVTADLSDPASNTGDALGDSYVSIENLEGGSFADWLAGDGGANALLGGVGDDVLHGGPGGDLLIGGSGDDTASYRHAAAAVLVNLGNAANNTGEAAGDIYAGIENLEGSSFDDDLSGDGTANVLRGRAGDDSIYGRAGDDALYGGPGGDSIFGGPGADVLRGAGGIDVLRGGPGDDRLIGGPDGDLLLAGGGNDILRGGGGDDILRGHAGDDRLFGAAGDDNLLGGGDPDRLFGGGGNDVLRGGGGDDILRGGPGDDLLVGAGGHDRLIGGNHADVLYGGAGNDVLLGNGGSDRLVGGAGDDRLIGQAGDDELIGNGGADVFVFQPNGGDDVVTGFQDDLDLLDFRAFDFASEASVLNLATQTGTDVVLHPARRRDRRTDRLRHHPAGRPRHRDLRPSSGGRAGASPPGARRTGAERPCIRRLVRRRSRTTCLMPVNAPVARLSDEDAEFRGARSRLRRTRAWERRQWTLKNTPNVRAASCRRPRTSRCAKATSASRPNIC